MKNFICLFLSFLIIILAVPTICFFAEDKTAEEAPIQVSAEETAEIKGKKTVTVFMSEQKKSKSVSLEDYLIGAAAKEISASSPDEAIKAQIICCHTYLLYLMQNNESKNNYDISDDPSVHQAYLSPEQLKKFWGENYDKNYKRMSELTEQVKSEYLSYEGKPILAAYHSSNSGVTESAEICWGSKIPYLIPVSSVGDRLSEDYGVKRAVSSAELSETLKKLKSDAVFSSSPEKWLGEIKKSKSGTVISAIIAGVSFSGKEIRTALNLRSANFDIEYSKSSFIFTTYGFGHGAGLSQAGAIYMAKQGFSYKTILLHYYNGVEIKRLDNV